MSYIPIEPMPQDAFKRLGGGHIAYVRPILSDEAHSLFPQAPPLALGVTLWALHGADGSPILLTGSRASAVANAREHELTAFSVH